MQPHSTYAQLDWSRHYPFSKQFQDIYFSTEDGLAETEYVFLTQNHLATRMGDSENLTIIETGFGSGLNFLCTWKLWQECAKNNTRLNFVSIEKYPLKPEDLAQSLSLFPTLDTLSQQVIAQYQPNTLGLHCLDFASGKIHLQLWIGDVSDILPQLNTPADAWFLDGFAPTKNPDMWQSDLFKHMARLSKPQTTFSTFTSAGIVRRGLQSAGFQVHKISGFGKKREMLCGEFIGPPPTLPKENLF